MQMLKSFFLTTLPVLIAAILCFTQAADSAEKDTTPPAPPAALTLLTTQEPVAKVNGVAISSMDLKRAQKDVFSNNPGLKVPPGEEKEFEKQVVNQLISMELLFQVAQKLEVKDLDKQVEAKLAQGRARFTSEKDFLKAIADLYLTENDLKERVRRDVVISGFVENTIMPKIKVTEEDVKKFYDQNPDKFKKSETARASHILIGVDAKASDEEKKKAREKADKLRKEIAGGADFATLAKDNSTCPSSKQGGDLGYFEKGRMVPPFEKAAFALKPGEVSEVVETQYGYHIIKLQEKKDAATVPFAEVQKKIEDFLKNQKINEAVVALVAEARKTAKIEILLK